MGVLGTAPTALCLEAASSKSMFLPSLISSRVRNCEQHMIQKMYIPDYNYTSPCITSYVVHLPNHVQILYTFLTTQVQILYTSLTTHVQILYTFLTTQVQILYTFPVLEITVGLRTLSGHFGHLSHPKMLGSDIWPSTIKGPLP